MLKAEINGKPSEEWQDVPVIPLGHSPAFSVLVSVDDEPHLKLLVGGSYEPECTAFQETLVWRDIVVVGYGERVYLVWLDDHHTQTIDLGCYFGYLYSTNECLLVASGERLFCLNAQGEMAWKSEIIAVDGVIVHDIRDGVIHGDAEHDPPGDWRPFQLRLNDGVVID